MFLIKIFHFFKGYVILSLKGHNKEETLKEILRRGINASDISYQNDVIFLRVCAQDFLKIQDSEDITLVKKTGAVFLWQALKKRKGFLIGMAIFLSVLLVGSQFIWSVEYDAPKDCDLAEIKAAAELAGVKTGAFKKTLKSGYEMKNIILNHTENISWCWVYIKGTKAVVRVRSAILPPEIFDPDTPCDIIAMRSGIIKDVITKRGKCIAEENTAVAPGDVIISGTYAFEDKPGYQVHSRGEVYAYTEHTKTKNYKNYYCYKSYTGKKRNLLTLKIYKWELPLYIKRKINFAEYDTDEKNYDLKIGRDNYIGLGIKKVSLSEYETVKEPISRDAAVELAKNELEAEISKELLQPAQLVDKTCDAVDIDSETVSVTVCMKFIEQIGTQKRIDEVTFIEPTTDNPLGGN